MASKILVEVVMTNNNKYTAEYPDTMQGVDSANKMVEDLLFDIKKSRKSGDFVEFVEDLHLDPRNIEMVRIRGVVDSEVPNA